MINVVVVCAAGMSSSLLIDKIKSVIKQQNEDIIVSGTTYVEVEKFKGNFDVLLLAPQISHLYDRYVEIFSPYGIKVDRIELKDLGHMNAEKIINQIKEIYKKEE